MQETARRTGASSEDIVIARTDVGHLLIGDRAVVERRAPVRTALEHRELANLVGDLRDQLDSGGAGADHGDLLAFEIDRLVRPIKGVERASPKILYAFDPRHGRRRQQTDGEHDEAAGQLAAVADFHLPEIARLVELHGLDGAVELHVFAQIELVGDVVQIPQVLGLAGEALLPVPFVEQFLRERKAVGVALGIEAAAGIAVPVPGAAEIGRRVEHGRVDAEIDEPFDLVDACDAGADDDHLVVGLGGCHCFLLRDVFLARAKASLQSLHSVLPFRATVRVVCPLRDRRRSAGACVEPLYRPPSMPVIHRTAG
ncbi:hypothetical protein ES707_07825 [subsurface metagenome]